MSERIGVLAAILSSTLGGTVAAVTRFVVADIDPLTLGALRFGGASWCCCRSRSCCASPGRRGATGSWVALLGGVYFCVYQVLYNVAFVYTTAAHGSMIGSTLALMTMVVAALFGVERLSVRKSAGVLVATGGVAVALAAGLAAAPPGAWRGDLIMLAGIFCWACYNIWSRPFIARSSPLTFLIGGMGVGAAGSARDRDVARRSWRRRAHWGRHSGSRSDMRRWSRRPIALWLWIFALNRASPTRVASTMAMHPVSASILAAIIIGEPIGLNLAVGVIAVLAGIWIAASEPRTSARRADMNERIGVLIAVLSSTFGGTAGAVTRYVVGTVDPVTIAAFRFGIGVAVLLPLALLLRSALPRGRDWIGVAALGVMFFAVFFVFYNIAMGYTTAARGALALSTLPLWTMVVAALLGAEPLTGAQDARRPDRGRRRRDRAARRPCGGAGRRVARRSDHGRRDAVHGVLQCLVAAVHRALLAARLRHRLDGRGRALPRRRRALERRLRGHAVVFGRAMDRGDLSRRVRRRGRVLSLGAGAAHDDADARRQHHDGQSDRGLAARRGHRERADRVESGCWA